MNRSVPRRPGAGKAQPSLQQQLASGKKAKAVRQAQQAQGRRKVPDAALPVPDAAPVGASVAGASHVSASRLLALLRPAAAPAAQPQPVSAAAYSGTDRQLTSSSSAVPALLHIATPSATYVADSFVSDNRKRQMGSSIFKHDPTPPTLPSTASTPHSTQSSHVQYSSHPPPTASLYPNLLLSTNPTLSASAAMMEVQPVVVSPKGRQSWGGGGRSLEAGSSSRDAEWQKKLDMRASLDAQMRDKEERRRQEKLQAQSMSIREQGHWLDAPTAAQTLHIQPPSTAARLPTAMSQTTHHTSTTSPAATYPYTTELLSSRSLSSTNQLSQPSVLSSSVHLSSIRSHNQSSSVFTTTGQDTTEQRKAAVRQEAQAALRQQMEEKKQRGEADKRREQEEERRWEEKLERERREMVSRHANGGRVLVEEERKEAVETGRRHDIGGASVSRVVQEEKQQLTVREDRNNGERVEKKRATSDHDSDSDEADEDRRRRRRARDKQARRDRDRRSTRRHSDSDDSASSHSDSSNRYSRHRSSRKHSRRRERRSRYSSHSDEDKQVDDECIYVADAAYTHRLRYEQEQKEADDAVALSASTSRRPLASSRKSKPASSSSSRPASALSAPPVPTVKPPFGVRSMQSRAQPKPPASRVRAPPPPMPPADTKAGKQALMAARLAMGRTSGGGERFVSQKWKDTKHTHTATHDTQPAHQPPKPALAVSAVVADGERAAVASGVHSGVDGLKAVSGMQELSLMDRLDSTSEWLLPHSLGLPSYRA